MAERVSVELVRCRRIKRSRKLPPPALIKAVVSINGNIINLSWEVLYQLITTLSKQDLGYDVDTEEVFLIDHAEALRDILEE